MDEQPKKKSSSTATPAKKTATSKAPAKAAKTTARSSTSKNAAPSTDEPTILTMSNKEVDDILASLLPLEESLSLAEKAEEEIDYEKQNTKLDYDIRLQRKLRRERWDTALLWLVIIGFGTSYILIFFIGFGLLKFGDNAFAIPAVVGAGVLQTFGLAKLAVEYFFTDDTSKRKKKK